MAVRIALGATALTRTPVSYTAGRAASEGGGCTKDDPTNCALVTPAAEGNSEIVPVGQIGGHRLIPHCVVGRIEWIMLEKAGHVDQPKDRIFGSF
jgi:hypothetical protein